MEQRIKAPREHSFSPVPATILSIEELSAQEKLFHLSLPSGMSLGHRPLQFVMVSLFGLGEAPISITSTPTKDETFDLCVRNVGMLTSRLHSLKAGDEIGIRGPFGNGADLEYIPERDLLFVAGGLGIAPLRSLINESLDHRERCGKITILYGAKSPEEQLFCEDLQRWEEDPDVEFLQTVDMASEGWKGNVGVITTLFKQIRINPMTTTPVICGPPIMYKFVIMELLSRGIAENRIYMSLERRMRCGLGRCGHCQINGTYVCQDGPVFTYVDAKRFKEAL